MNPSLKILNIPIVVAPFQAYTHCAYQVTLTQIFKNLTKILPLLGGKSYLIQTQNSDLAEIIKGENFN